MTIDHYEDLTKGVNEGKISQRRFFEKFTTSPGTTYTDMPTYGDYVAVTKSSLRR